jgi:hypothetical protein
MQIGDVIRLEDLPLPQGVTLLDDAGSTVVSVSVPAMDVSTTEAEVEEEVEGQALDGETAAEDGAADQ